jgi:hypothetical protein
MPPTAHTDAARGAGLDHRRACLAGRSVTPRVGHHDREISDRLDHHRRILERTTVHHHVFSMLLGWNTRPRPIVSRVMPLRHFAK